MKKLFALILLLFAVPTFAQKTTSSSGNITASGATCGTTNACISLFMVDNVSSVSVTVSGTYSGTLQFELSSDGGSNFVAASPASTTSTGVFTFPASAWTNFRVRASAFASGTATIFINTSTAAGGGTVTSVTGTSPIVSSGGSTPAISCPTCSTTGGAPTTASYLLTQSNGSLPNGIVWLYPDNSPASPNALDDEFNAGSLSGSWTWANQGSCTTAESSGFLGITCPSNGGSHNIRYIWKTPPATPWAFVIKLTHNGSTSLGFLFTGLIAIESATNKSVTTAFDNNNGGSPAFGVGGCAWTNLTTRNDCGGATESNGPSLNNFNTVYLKVSDDGTTITSAWSIDGANYQTISTHTVATFFTSAPDRIGVFMNPFSQASVTGVDYFRRTL